MDLAVSNEITNNTNDNNEIGDFIEELQNALTEENDTTINREILNESELANKYKDQLNDIVVSHMKELSYDCDCKFIYCDYDKKTESYYWDFYEDGEVSRQYLTSEEAIGEEEDKGLIFRIWDEDHILEAEELKDYVKSTTEYTLENLEKKRQGD